MERVAKRLEAMRTAAKAKAAVMLSGDGVVLATAGEPGVDLTSLAPYAASGVMGFERFGEGAAYGAPEVVTVTYQNRTLVMAPVGPAVAVLMGSASNMGVMRLELLRHAEALAAALNDQVRDAADRVSQAHLDHNLIPPARPQRATRR
jgi:predicted regulator of Ras-like GTPase activity (Roadblock/LC7/MglB family)